MHQVHWYCGVRYYLAGIYYMYVRYSQLRAVTDRYLPISAECHYRSRRYRYLKSCKAFNHRGYVFVRYTYTPGYPGTTSWLFGSYKGIYLGRPRVYTQLPPKYTPGYPESIYPGTQRVYSRVPRGYIPGYAQSTYAGTPRVYTWLPAKIPVFMFS